MGYHYATGQNCASATVFYLTELREKIMVYLDPSNMLNLVLTSHAPMASFKRNPKKFLNLSVGVGVKRSRIHYYAMSILAAPVCLETTQTKERWSEAGRDKQWSKLFQDPFLDAAITLDPWLTKDILTAPVPDVLYRQPLKSLKNLAYIHETVEFLIGSRLLASCDLSTYGVDVYSEQGSEGTGFSKADIIRECLWYFQFRCVVFPHPRLVEDAQVSFRKVELEFRWASRLGEPSLLDPSVKPCFSQICNKLLETLQTVFEHSCAIAFDKSTHRFLPYLSGLNIETHPLHHLIKAQLKNQVYWEKGLAKKPYVIFRRYTDHQLPLGLPFLAWMHRISVLSVQSVQSYPKRRFFRNWRTWLLGTSCGSDRCMIRWRQLKQIRGHGWCISRQSSAGDQEYVFILTPYRARKPSIISGLDPRVIGSLCEDWFKSVKLALRQRA